MQAIGRAAMGEAGVMRTACGAHDSVMLIAHGGADGCQGREDTSMRGLQGMRRGGRDCQGHERMRAIGRTAKVEAGVAWTAAGHTTRACGRLSRPQGHAMRGVGARGCVCVLAAGH